MYIFKFFACSFLFRTLTANVPASSATFSSKIKVGLIYEESSPANCEDYFLKLLSNLNENANVPPLVVFDGVVVKWKTGGPPLRNINTVKTKFLVGNVTVVFSVLGSGSSGVFNYLMANSRVPVIQVLVDEDFLAISELTNTSLNLSLVPSEELQAAVVRNIMFEFDQSRFACITTSLSRNDPFWKYLFQYVVNKDNFTLIPRCLVLENDDTALGNLHKTLTAIRASGVQLIILHAGPEHTSAILEIAQKLSIDNVGDGVIWILTDVDHDINALYLPVGTIGIAKAYNTSTGHLHGLVQSGSMCKLLLQDGVTLLTRALSSLLKEKPSLLKQIQIGRGLAPSSRKALYRAMIQSSFDGKTGLVEFSPVGRRISYGFVVTRLDRPLGGTKQWTRLGVTSTHLQHSDGPMVFEAFLEKDLPKPRHLRIVTIIHDPFTMVKEPLYRDILGTTCSSWNSVICIKYENTSSYEHNVVTRGPHANHEPYKLFCCYGVMIDILILMQRQSGFTFDLYIVRDGKFGSYDENTHRMNGMIGDIHRGEADMALATLSITNQRYKYVDFASPFMGTSLAFLVRRQSIKKYPFPESLQDMRLMKPFSIWLWLTCVGTFLVVSTTVCLIEKFTKYRHIKSEYFLPFEYMAYVFGNIFHVPLTRVEAKTYAVPCLMVWANFGALVLISSYTANLLVSLIVVDEVTIVKGVDDEKLLNPPKDFTFGTIKDSSVEDYFRNSENQRLQKIYANMKSNSVHNFSEGVEKVRSGVLSAFIGESDALMYEISEDPKCGLKIDGKQLELAGLAFALAKNSSWEREISKTIYKLTMRESITKTFKRWAIKSCTKGVNNVEPFGMGLDEFGGFLFNTVLCCFGCFAILGIEFFFYRRISKTRRKFKIQCDTKSTTTLVTSVSMETMAFSSLVSQQIHSLKTLPKE